MDLYDTSDMNGLMEFIQATVKVSKHVVLVQLKKSAMQ